MVGLKWTLRMLMILLVGITRGCSSFLLGLGVKLALWIKGCLSSSIGIYSCNGSPTSGFRFIAGESKGCRYIRFPYKAVLSSMEAIRRGFFNGGKDIDRKIASKVLNDQVDKDCYVDIKLKVPVASSFRRMVRGGVEASQLAQLNDILGSASPGYQIRLESLEARIVVHEKNEAVYEEDIAFLKYDVQVKDISIKDLKNYRESDVDDSPVNDRFKIGEGFHAVPPPYTGNYMPSRPDLSFAGLDDSVYKTKTQVSNGLCPQEKLILSFYVQDYQEIDGGFIAFEGSPKGGKITRKCKIRTEKLDFEDVYFVKELKFNLFFVLQMCNKKNSVLFTETECLILSPDFKLLDESQVLLKFPRHNNMYSFDLKNVVPSEGLTCLFVKDTIDESITISTIGIRAWKAAGIVVIWLGKNPNSSRVCPFLSVVHNSSKDAHLLEAAATIIGSNRGLYYSLKLSTIGVYITTAIGKQFVLLEFVTDQ
ncbi:hypothetical protein Tco_0951906 [Tanacetum coccineum]|uniref:Uncharacterized protein n=1 Tax=Tanacetum coccineum TaxID=301880 RepID=A0ABQ5DVH3_9ASTR